MPPASVTKRLQRAPLTPVRAAGAFRLARQRARIRLRWARSSSRNRGIVAARLRLVGIGRIDAGHQRLSHSLQRFAPEPAADEGAQALVGAGRAPRQQEIERHARLAAPGEQRGGDEGPETRRGQELETFGQRVQPPACQTNVLRKRSSVPTSRSSRSSRRQSARAHGFSERNESLGPASSRNPPARSVAIAPPRRSGASRTVRSRAKAALAGDLQRAVGRGQPRDAATRRSRLIFILLDQSASIAMNSG